MCGPDTDELSRMEYLAYCLNEAGELLDETGVVRDVSAQDVGKAIGCTPQVAGKVLQYFNDIWERRIVGGQVMYLSKERR